MEKISKLQKELDRISSYAQKSEVCTEIGNKAYFLTIIKYHNRKPISQPSRF